MNEIDTRFSSLGLLTYHFEVKFKKVLLFLQTMDNPEIVFNVTCFLDIQELLSLTSTCKKLYDLKQNPVMQVRILKQKIRFLESPKQAFNSLSLLPGYYQFLLHQKQEEKQIPKNAEVFFKNVKEIKKYREFLNKKKELALQSKSPYNTKIIESEKTYEGMVSKIEKLIEEEAKIYVPIQLSKKPEKKPDRSKSYVQKFREEYAKVKQFERNNNIRELESLHRKESEKIKLKQIETPFRTIPIIEIKDDEKISVVNADAFYKTTASKYLNRVKAIFGLNIYY